MEIEGYLRSLGVNLKPTQNNQKTHCPKCHDGRKHKSDKSLSVNLGKKVWKCHHCGWTGKWDNNQINEKKYEPCHIIIEVPDDSALKYLESRGISRQTVIAAKVGTAVIHIGKENKKAICFPYYRGERLLSVKYRTISGKDFLRTPNCEPSVWMEDTIEAGKPLYWTEGEIDALTLMECGIENVVSVPNGASDNEMDWLIGMDEKLASVAYHVLCFDLDAPGQVLKDRLRERLPGEVYQWVPAGNIKDVNELYLSYGRDAVIKALEAACRLKSNCLVYPLDLQDELLARYDQGGEPPGWKSSCKALAEHYCARTGEMTVLTGIPGSGKSRWLDWLLVDYASQYGLRFGVWSPEIGVYRHTERLAALVAGKPVYGLSGLSGYRMTRDEYVEAISIVNQYIVFLSPVEPTPQGILVAAQKAIDDGCVGIVIDPYNEVILNERISEHENINAMLRLWQTKLVRSRNIHLWVVAHPKKLMKELLEGGKMGIPAPTPYDISGSAHWYNRADMCVTIHRNQGMTEVHIQKVRFEENGKTGKVTMTFDTVTGRFFDASPNQNDEDVNNSPPF